MTDIKYLANENVNYYPIIKNSDGSVFINGNKYAKSLIGVRVKGISNSVESVADNFYVANSPYGENKEYSMNETNWINENQASSGTVFGTLKYQGKIYVAINNSKGFPLVTDKSNDQGQWVSSQILWLQLDKLKIIGGVISHLKCFIHRLLTTSSLEVA